MSWRRPVPLFSATIGLLVFSVSLNALQTRRILALVSTNAVTPTTIGRTAGPLVGFSLSGVPREVTLRSDRPTLVYYFDPACTYCQRNWPNLEALAAAAPGRYRVIATSAKRDLRRYLTGRQLSLDVVEGLSVATWTSFGFSGTPHTIVVSPEGMVTHDWRGAFTPRVQRQLEDLFGVDLPGMAPPSVEAPTPEQ